MHQALFRAHVLQFAICVCQVLDLLYGRHQVLLIVYLQLPDGIERELKRFEWLVGLLRWRFLRLHLDTTCLFSSANIKLYYGQMIIDRLRLKMLSEIFRIKRLRCRKVIKKLIKSHQIFFECESIFMWSFCHCVNYVSDVRWDSGYLDPGFVFLSHGLKCLRELPLFEQWFLLRSQDFLLLNILWVYFLKKLLIFSRVGLRNFWGILLEPSSSLGFLCSELFIISWFWLFVRYKHGLAQLS